MNPWRRTPQWLPLLLAAMLLLAQTLALVHRSAHAHGSSPRAVDVVAVEAAGGEAGLLKSLLGHAPGPLCDQWEAAHAAESCSVGSTVDVAVVANNHSLPRCAAPSCLPAAALAFFRSRAPPLV